MKKLLLVAFTIGVPVAAIVVGLSQPPVREAIHDYAKAIHDWAEYQREHPIKLKTIMDGYTCETVVSQVLKMANEQMKTLRIWDVREVKRTPEKISCVGTAYISPDREIPINFAIVQKHGEQFVLIGQEAQ